MIYEAPGSEVTKTISVQIKDFTKKINDLENKNKPIESPVFKVAGKELSIRVYPGGIPEGSGGVSVYLSNRSKESIKVAVNFKASCCGSKSYKDREIPVGQMWGFGNFISFGAFEEWAAENDDLFILEVRVTLHIQGASHWTTER